MSFIQGDIYIFNGNGAVIAAAKSCTIKRHCGAIEKASASNATEREYIADRSEWSIELSHLVVSDAPTGGIPMIRQTYTLTVKVGDTSVLQGAAICTDATITSNVGNLAKGSISFQGSGPLEPPPSS
jgi:predicted secreted protein